MDESTLGSLRHRVPILDGEYFHEWKNEMLVIFNEYHLNKYITSPCAPHVDPMHPTLDESIDMRCTRASNVLFQMIFIENHKHLIFPLMKILSIKYRHSMSMTTKSYGYQSKWRPKL